MFRAKASTDFSSATPARRVDVLRPIETPYSSHSTRMKAACAGASAISKSSPGSVTSLRLVRTARVGAGSPAGRPASGHAGPDCPVGPVGHHASTAQAERCGELDEGSWDAGQEHGVRKWVVTITAWVWPICEARSGSFFLLISALGWKKKPQPWLRAAVSEKSDTSPRRSPTL